MAGPTCSVLTSLPCEPKALIEEMVSLCGADMDDSRGVSIGDTRAIGGLYTGSDRPFVWFIEPRDADELCSIAEVIGSMPTQDIGLAAMCNQEIDHRILGEMALWLAENTNGFVDLGGDDLPIPPEMPGRVARIPYDTASGWQSEYVIMDHVAFRAWLRCPAFAMVK